MRKSFKLAHLLATVNRKNQCSTCSPDVRDGWNSLLSQLLMDADVYAGYGYFRQEEIPASERPGIQYSTPEGKVISADDYYKAYDAYHMPDSGGNYDANRGDFLYEKSFPDESRRHFYIHEHLTADYLKFVETDEYRHAFPLDRRVLSSDYGLPS